MNSLDDKVIAQKAGYWFIRRRVGVGIGFNRSHRSKNRLKFQHVKMFLKVFHSGDYHVYLFTSETAYSMQI
jgi:hypothetical protein